VDRVIVEADGDYHIRLELDPSYQNLTNSVNDSDQYDDLVLSPFRGASLGWRSL